MKGLTCEEARLLLSNMVTEPLDSAEAELLDTHLAECEQCRGQAEAFFRQDRALAELALVAEPLLARIRQGLPGHAPTHETGAVVTPRVLPRRPGLARRWWAAGIAAALLLALGAWLLLGPHGDESARVQMVVGDVYFVTAEGKTLARAGAVVSPGSTLRTMGEQSLVGIVYADGTRLEVGADSTLTQLTEKKVFLAEGYLKAEVAEQPPGRPMLLSTPRAEVQALATKFSLAGGPEATHLETMEGVAQLTRTSDGQSIDVAAGFDVIVQGDVKPMAPQRVQRFYSPRTVLGGASAAAFSPDGATLATWAGQAVMLWEAGSARQRATLHVPGVTTAAFSRDGRLLATASTAPALQLWNVLSGERRSMLDAPPGVTDLAFSADGKFLTGLAEKGKDVARWDLATLQLHGTLKRFPSRATLSADGDIVAAISGDGATIVLWDLAAGQWKAPLHWGSDHSAQFVLAFSRDGQMLAASSASTVKVWQVASGELQATFDVRPANVQRLAFSPDGTLLALRDGVKVTLWHLPSRTRKAVLQNLVRPAGPLTFSPDGRILATSCGAGNDSRVKLWELP